MPTMIYSVPHHLDKVAVRGLVRVEAEADEFFGGPRSQPYKSRPMKNPTWRRLMKCAEAQRKKTRDDHHVFLEGVESAGRDGNVTVIRLALGS